MSKRLKKITRIILAVVAVMGVAAIIVLANLDYFVKVSIEAVVGHALGLDTEIESVHLDLRSGEFQLRELVVANPEETFHTPYAMRVGAVDVKMKPDTLFGDVIEVTSFTVKEIELNMELQFTHFNLSALIRNLGDSRPEAKKSNKKGKRYRIDHVLVQNVKAEAHIWPAVIGPKLGSTAVTVPEFSVKDLTPESARGLLLGEVVRKVMPAVLSAVVSKTREVVTRDGVAAADRRLDGRRGKLFRKMLGTLLDLVARDDPGERGAGDDE